MNRMSLLKLASIGLLAFGLTARYAHADVVIGDFETGVDGWGTDGGDASFNGDPPHYAQSTTGVTLHTHSIAVTQNIHPGTPGPGASPAPHFDPAATGNTVSQVGAANYGTVVKLSFDESFIATQLFQSEDPNDPSANSFAQSNELIWSISGQGGSLGTSTVSVRAQKAAGPGRLTDSSTTVAANRGAWNGTDHTATLSWDLTQWTTTDPTDNTVKSFAQLIAAHPDVAWDSKFGIPLGSGDSTLNGVGFSTFFFDNVKLIQVPEPASLGLLALGGLLGLRRRK